MNDSPLKVFFIKRFSDCDYATFGILCESIFPFAVTLEDAWKNNQQNISCIPIGEYTCKRYSSEKYPDVWQIMNVIGRDKILLHWGNKDEDTQGCPLIAEKFITLSDGRVGIGESKNFPNEGFNEFMNRTKGLDEIKLVIEKAIGWVS